MKKYIILLFCLFLSIPAFAQNDDLKFYVGLHGNESWSNTKDGNQRIDNGDTKSKLSFSITAGVEGNKKIFDSQNIKIVAGMELFFDYIDKTTIQGDQKWRDSWIRPMANKPIYKTNFLTGLRGKLGLRLFDRADIYGHLGLSYWERDLYLHLGKDPYYKLFGIDDLEANWKFMPFIGVGATVHITNHWAINANYMRILQSKIGDLTWDESGVNYHYGSANIEIGIDILTIGVLYYF